MKIFQDNVQVYNTTANLTLPAVKRRDHFYVHAKKDSQETVMSSALVRKEIKDKEGRISIHSLTSAVLV